MKHILLLLMALSNLAHAEAAVRVGEISDKRTTGEFFSGLEIKLLVSGPELAEAKGLRVKIDSATDNTGKSLIKSGQTQHVRRQVRTPQGTLRPRRKEKR